MREVHKLMELAENLGKSVLKGEMKKEDALAVLNSEFRKFENNPRKAEYMEDAIRIFEDAMKGR